MQQPEPRAPWWREADEAVALLVSILDTVAGQAGRDGSYQPPPGAPAPRRRRTPASLRHIAEIIRTHRLAPGSSVDKDTVAQALAGDPAVITDPIAVIAVVHACHHIAGLPFEVAEAARVAAACTRIAVLIEAAKAADERAPHLLPVRRPPSALERLVRSEPRRPRPRRRWGFTIPRVVGWVAALALVPVLAAGTGALVALRMMPQDTAPAGTGPDLPCTEGASGSELVRSEVVGPDEDAQMIEPVLDFDEMNGSARYHRYQGRTYYWGRAGSDDNVPRAGGARIRWQVVGGRWHDCPVLLPVEERGYVRTVAVSTTIGGQAVRVQVCLWRQSPYRENCSVVLS